MTARRRLGRWLRRAGWRIQRWGEQLDTPPCTLRSAYCVGDACRGCDPDTDWRAAW